MLAAVTFILLTNQPETRLLGNFAFRFCQEIASTREEAGVFLISTSDRRQIGVLCVDSLLFCLVLADTKETDGPGVIFRLKADERRVPFVPRVQRRKHVTYVS